MSLAFSVLNLDCIKSKSFADSFVVLQAFNAASVTVKCATKEREFQCKNLKKYINIVILICQRLAARESHLPPRV